MKTLPPQDELTGLLHYDPATGNFRWREPRLGARANGVAGTLRAGYRDICIDGFNYGAHRLAWKYVHGRDPVGEIDHINGIRTDNRIENLRDATVEQQRRNAARPRTNTSGIVGVCFATGKGKWKAYAHINNRLKHIGYFATKEEAAQARTAFSAEHGFHPNHGRAA